MYIMYITYITYIIILCIYNKFCFNRLYRVRSHIDFTTTLYTMDSRENVLDNSGRKRDLILDYLISFLQFNCIRKWNKITC